MNSILEACAEVRSVNQALRTKEWIELAELGTPSIIDGLRIRRINFKSLVYIRFLSIFNSFKLVQSNMSTLHEVPATNRSNNSNRSSKLLYLKREDYRVKNQKEIEELVRNKLKGDAIGDLHKLSFAEKIKLLNSYNQILMPPGSDNINGLCFSNLNSKLYQMINCRVENILKDPFYSLAGLRYLLPFLDRVELIPSINAKKLASPNSGSWLLSDLHTRLEET